MQLIYDSNFTYVANTAFRKSQLSEFHEDSKQVEVTSSAYSVLATVAL